MPTPRLEDFALEWVMATVEADRVLSVTGLREGGSPWLVHYQQSGSEGRVVLRVGPPDSAAGQEGEARGIGLAGRGGVPVAGVIAFRADDHAALLLIEYVVGTSAQPVEPDAARLLALGAVAARISAVDIGSASLPVVTRPIAGVDFQRLRAESAPQPLLEAAEKRISEVVPDDAVGFVHGDLWSGNTLWSASGLAAVVDWDCAGRGPAGVDLGSLRCDAAMCCGLEAADVVRAGWEEAAGRAAESVAYWDVVAALSTPPDIAWFAEAIAGMTRRPDLTPTLLRRRRDAFLSDALSRLG